VVGLSNRCFNSSSFISFWNPFVDLFYREEEHFGLFFPSLPVLGPEIFLSPSRPFSGWHLRKIDGSPAPVCDPFNPSPHLAIPKSPASDISFLCIGRTFFSSTVRENYFSSSAFSFSRLFRFFYECFPPRSATQPKTHLMRKNKMVYAFHLPLSALL